MEHIVSVPDAIEGNYMVHSRPTVLKEEPPLWPKSFHQKISINLSEKLSIKQALSEVAHLLGASLSLDPNISKGLSFSAHDIPFKDIIHSISEMAGLRYILTAQNVRLERDIPYSEVYNIQFLNFSRTSQNRIATATDVFATAQNTKGAPGDNGSNSSIVVTANNDFWLELENNLKLILTGSSSSTTATYAFHKQAGVVSIYGTQKQHKQAKEYLRKIRQSIRSQVLIEAKIIEVSLNDQFRGGINWQKLTGKGAVKFSANLGSAAATSRFLPPETVNQQMITLSSQTHHFSALLEALQEFGISRILSSPRLTVMNNQTAILKVAQNQVYFRVNYEKQYWTQIQRDSVSVASDIQTVPIGLVMSVQPSIDEASGEVILFLRPTISRLSYSVKDPAVDIAYTASLRDNNTGTTAPTALIPVVEVREIDSVLRLASGEVAILGGLMETRSYKDVHQIPGLGDVPVIQDAFRAQAEGDQVVELVILLRVKVMDDAAPPTPDAQDIRIQGMIKDPRPLT